MVPSEVCCVTAWRLADRVADRKVSRSSAARIAGAAPEAPSSLRTTIRQPHDHRTVTRGTGRGLSGVAAVGFWYLRRRGVGPCALDEADKSKEATTVDKFERLTAREI